MDKRELKSIQIRGSCCRVISRNTNKKNSPAAEDIQKHSQKVPQKS